VQYCEYKDAGQSIPILKKIAIKKGSSFELPFFMN